jgi:GNAT superfamily N-acetyltransferase
VQTFISVPFEKAENKREIKRLYRTAFPRAERTAFYKILRACKRGVCAFSAYFENGAFAGVSVALEREAFVYLFFLAVNEDARGKGIGGRILNAVAERYAGKTVALDIEALDEEAPNASERVRRKEFYLRNGYRPLNVFFSVRGVRYETLVRGEGLSAEAYLKFVKERVKEFRA